MMKKAKRLNIAHMHWGFPPIIGGVETHLTIILPEMVELGHRVSLLTGSVEGMKGFYKYKGVNVYRTPLMDLNWLFKRGLAGLEEEVHSAFSNFIDKSRPDVIHAHNMNYFSKIHAEALQDISKKKGIPIFLTAHNSWDDLLFLELAHKIDWTHIIAVSFFIKKELMGVGIDDRKISVVHHGVDEGRFKPKIVPKRILEKYPQLKGRPVVFHPARMGLAKGCDVSVKAISRIKERHPDVILVLAGSKNIIDWGSSQQKDIAYIVNLIKHFNLEDNMLIDCYSLDDMPQLYAVSTVCIYPSSVGEPFGLTMLEALASGKPMIVTNSGGMPEIIRDGINGFVIPIRDFEVLASRINQVIEDYKLRIRLGYTGRKMVESQYTKRRVTEENISVYRRFL